MFYLIKLNRTYHLRLKLPLDIADILSKQELKFSLKVSRKRLAIKKVNAIKRKLNKDGSFDEIYNGPGTKVWSLLKNKPRPKNGQYQISLSRLSKIMMSVPKEQQISMVRF